MTNICILGCIWFDEASWGVGENLTHHIRQLLLQAYCTFSAYNQHEVFIMLVSGVYFTLFKFTRPETFETLPQAPAASRKKRKLEAEEVADGTNEPSCQVAKEISNSKLMDMIPLEYVDVVYPRAPVFSDINAGELHLSDPFRQALHERLVDVNFQPCSLFDLHTAQYVPEDLGIVRSIESETDQRSQSLPGSGYVCNIHLVCKNKERGYPKDPRASAAPIC